MDFRERAARDRIFWLRLALTYYRFWSWNQDPWSKQNYLRCKRNAQMASLRFKNGW